VQVRRRLAPLRRGATGVVVVISHVWCGGWNGTGGDTNVGTAPMTSLLETMARYEMTASWAVWPPSVSYGRRSDISFPFGDLDRVLHARSVILGLSPGESSVQRRPLKLL
jgi:hypothetical protein